MIEIHIDELVLHDFPNLDSEALIESLANELRPFLADTVPPVQVARAIQEAAQA
jgi:hypothetical protein